MPIYASDINQDIPDEKAVIYSLSEEEINKGPRTVSDYSNNELAVEAVKRNITLFTERIREKFSLWLSRSGKYLDLMKEILKEKDVPEEIVFLSLIESGFNPYAYSPARAAGYWQFIASTAKRYVLEINWWKDERRDPVKSTVAAANYLKTFMRCLARGIWQWLHIMQGKVRSLKHLIGQKQMTTGRC